jgi:hypothetical protein
MNLKLDREKGNLIVSELVLQHNHVLHLPQTRHLLVSQKKISYYRHLKLKQQMIQELDQKQHMSWLLIRLAEY